MEDILKKEYTKEEINNLFSKELQNHYLKRDEVVHISPENLSLYSKYNENKEINLDSKEKKENSRFTKFKIKLMGKVVVSLSIFLGVMCYKYYPETIKNSSIISYIKIEYNRNYSKSEILEKFEDISYYAYTKFEKIVPESAYNYITSEYVNNIKPKILNFSIKNIFEKEQVAVAVFNEEDFKVDDSEAAPIVEEAIAVNSELSLMEMDKEEILAKNISIIQPVSGTITSTYGAREEILDVVGYHTGIDIANSYNTEIMSATDGTVTKAEENNYYYGNNIEIENNGVIFKYAHLNSLSVSEGDSVSQGQVIGLMGATGQATGSHLHFEIRINSRTVDPELILDFN